MQGILPSFQKGQTGCKQLTKSHLLTPFFVLILSAFSANAQLTVSLDVVEPCLGFATGMITALPEGGTTPYAYRWTTGDSTQTINDLPAGAYGVTVTDAGGLSATASVTTEYDNLEVFLEAQVCTAPYTVTATVVNGEGPYWFDWDTGEVGETIEVESGKYCITLTDNNKCARVECITIDVQPLELTIKTRDATCPQGADGEMNVEVAGGTPPYSYQWSNDETTKIIRDLSPGVYSVTVTDASGCTAETSGTILDQDPILINIASEGPVCIGDENGKIATAVAGGTPPYKYLWNTDDITPGLVDVPVGKYIVTVTDDQGCEAVDSVELTPQSTLELMMTSTDQLCPDGEEGMAETFPSGGVQPYSYAWSNGAATKKIMALTPGKYFVTVTDQSGCVAVDSATIEPAPGFEISVAVEDVTSCEENNGAAEVTIISGVQPVSYQWSNGAATARVEGLGAGIYSVTVTNGNACELIRFITIDDPPTIDIEADGTDMNCPDSNDGTATVAVVGGITPYNYEWSNGGDTKDISGLSSGIYRVTVTDANGCSAVDSVLIDKPADLVLDLMSKNLACAGVADGMVMVEIDGGTPGYQISWSNGATGDVQLGLSAGTYTVTVVDANGCTAQGSTTLTEPDPLTVAARVEQNVCAGETTGGATALAAGGAGGYQYEWSNQQTGPNLRDVPAGEYIVTVTDANECTVSDTVIITAFANPVCEVTVISDVTDIQNPDGAAEAIASGGEGPYLYQWSDGQTTALAENLPAGDYTVTITDANGCTTTCSVTIKTMAGLGDFVWEDINRNGIQDEMEPPVPGVDVKLKDAQGNVIGTTTTDDNGKYSFVGLQPGTYSVMFVVPNGFEFTILNGGLDDNLDSDADPNMDGMTNTVTLVEGEFNPTLDAGISLSPESEFVGVCNCLNNATNEDNGQFLETVTIFSYPGETWTLIRADNMFAADSPEPPADPKPLAAGTSIPEIDEGEYQLKFRVVDDLFFTGLFTNGMDTITLRNICTYPTINARTPEAEICVLDEVFILTADPSVPGTVVFTLNGEVVTEIDPAELGVGVYELIVTLLPDDAEECEATLVKTITIDEGCLAMIGDFVWLDVDRDGRQDTGEPGIPGVKVIVSSADGTYTESTYTDVHGLYKFTVPLGDYKITFVKPEGMLGSPKDVGNDNEKDSDPDPETGMTDIFTLNGDDPGFGAMVMDFSWDAGFYSPCENITDPGEVGYDQMVCGPGVDPEPFVSIRDASGGQGEIEYLWMMSTQDGPFDPDLWTLIPNSNSPTYDPGPLYYTTYFARCARREDCITFLETNIVKVTVKDDAVARIAGPQAVCQGTVGAFTSQEHGPGAAIRWELERLGFTVTSAEGPEFSFTFPSTGIFYVILYVTENGCTSMARHRLSVTTNPTVCGTGFVIDASAMEDQRQVKVAWQLRTDAFSQQFIIEHAGNSQDFRPLAEIDQPVRTENAMDQYEFIHETPKNGWNYYRVILENEWGNRITSDVAEVVIYADSKLLLAYPNPVRDELVLELFETFNADITFEIFNISGIRMDQIEVNGDLHRQRIDLSSYPAGAYFLRVRYGEADLKVLRIIKE